MLASPTDHSWTLQAVMEMQKTLGTFTAKIDRLCEDVSGLDTKVSDLQHKVSFVKGAVWVIGILVALAGLASAFGDKIGLR